jgi:hypothetical protein
MREAVRVNYLMPESVSSTNIHMQRLKQAFDADMPMLDSPGPRSRRR